MELSKAKVCIISVGIGGWYGDGVRRLVRTLNYHGFPGDILTWADAYPPLSYPHEEMPYYFKIAAFEDALRQGYTHILWVDASFWAVKNPIPLFDIIDEQGYYMFSSGYNLAQTVNDAALSKLDLTRDEVEASTEWASGCVGFNFRNPDAVHIYSLWKEYMDAGLSIGGRFHDGQSKDPRFMHHRQDQSCLSLAMHRLKLKNEKGLDYVAYKNTGHVPEKLIFFIEGIG